MLTRHLFAPTRQFAQNRQLAAVEHVVSRHTHPRMRFVKFMIIRFLRIFGHFRFKKGQIPQRLQLLLQQHTRLRHVLHVFRRVFQLPRRQRTLQPVRPCLRLREIHAKQAVQKILQRQLRRHADKARRDPRVEDVPRQRAAPTAQDRQVAGRLMEDFHDGFILQQRLKRPPVRYGQRVHQGVFTAVAGQLNEP